MSEKRKKYATLGNEPVPGQSKKAWILPIDEFKKIDPRYYFITTGEATIKIEVLLKDIKELAKQAKKLQKELTKTKGESDYLETCWEDGNLVIKKKEKRSRSAKSKSKQPKPKAKSK